LTIKVHKTVSILAARSPPLPGAPMDFNILVDLAADPARDARLMPR
jgi:hypothetical protein